MSELSVLYAPIIGHHKFKHKHTTKYALKLRQMNFDGKLRVQNNFDVINNLCFFNTSTVSARLIRAEVAAQLKAAQFVLLQSQVALICADQSELSIPKPRPITRLPCIFSGQSKKLKLPLNHEQNQSKTKAGCFPTHKRSP